MRLPLLLALTALTACTHTRTAESAGDLADLGRRAEGRRVVVALADGRRLPAEGLRFAPDSASWVDPETRALHRVATADVAAVTFGRRRGRGALEGFAIGTGAGALGGAAVGYATYDDGGFGCFFICSRGAAASWRGSTFGLVGALFGTAVGAVRGSPDVYRLRPPAVSLPPRDASSAPRAPGSEQRRAPSQSPTR